MRRSNSGWIAIIVGLLAVSNLGGVSTAEAQLKYTGCLRKDGKIVRVAPGDIPARPCRKNQTQITFTGSEETDALIAKDADLAATDQELKAMDEELMAADSVLRKRVGELEEQVELLTQCFGTDRYVDQGLTVFDCKTRLEWEKKLPRFGGSGATDCIKTEAQRDVRCVNNRYSWSTCSGPDPQYPALGDCPPDGTAFTVFLAALNTPPCFAGHCDWRLPELARGDGIRLDGTPANTAELETIPVGDHPIFGPGEGCGGTGYLSSITDSRHLNFAYNCGGPGSKTGKVDFARAVRAGP